MLTEKKFNALHWEENKNGGEVAKYGIFEIYRQNNLYSINLHIRLYFSGQWKRIPDGAEGIDLINREIEKFRENTSEILFQLEKTPDANIPLNGFGNFFGMSGDKKEFLEICNVFSKTIHLL